AECDERWSETGSADKQGWTVRGEDRVVTILALAHERCAALLRKQTKSVAKVPATRALAQIAADGTNRPKLWTSDAFGGCHERRELLFHIGVLDQFAQRGHRSDA